MKLLNRYHLHISVLAGALFVVSVLTASGCATSQNPRLPEPSTLLEPGSPDMAAHEEGRALYLTECAACHTRIMPDEHTKEEWGEILERHRGRVPAGQTEYDNLCRYILLASEVNRGN